MSLLSILGAVMRKRIAGDTSPAVVHTPTPMSLYQGSVVTLPTVDLALAQVDGSLLTPPVGDQIVTAVGWYTLFDHLIYHVYLGDGTSYLQLVMNGTGQPGDRVAQVRLWTSRAEVLPQTTADWEFWLGSYVKDADGALVRDAWGKTTLQESGLIGWPQFQIDNPQTIYDRAWQSGPEGIAPVAYTETIQSADSLVSQIRHESCEYFRNLGDPSQPTVESLLASLNQTNGAASVNIWIGIELDASAIRVLAS